MNAICSRRSEEAEEFCKPDLYRGNDAEARVLLRKGEVRTLHQRDRVAGIMVMSGVVWLTKTPADADIILGANERFRFPCKWPVVIEALENTEIFFQATE